MIVYFLTTIYKLSELENNHINLESSIFEIFVFLGEKLIKYIEINMDKDASIFYKFIKFLTHFHKNKNKYDNIMKSIDNQS